MIEDDIEKMNALFAASDAQMAVKNANTARVMDEAAQAIKARLIEQGIDLIWDEKGMGSWSGS